MQIRCTPDLEPMLKDIKVVHRLEVLGFNVESITPNIRLRADSPPSILELMAQAAVWTPLAVAATAFLKKIAEHTADEIWANRQLIAFWLKERTVHPFHALCDLLHEMRDRSSDDGYIGVGIPLPDHYFGTRIILDEATAEEMAVKLALFIAHAEDIQIAVRTLGDDEDAPLGPVFIEVSKEGTLSLTWMGGDTLLHKNKTITKGFAEHAPATNNSA